MIVLFVLWWFGDRTVSSQSVCVIRFHNNMLEANCSSRGLPKIPENLPKNLTTLTLRNNYIKSTENLQYYRGLQHLDLSFNNFTQFRRKDFHGMSQLQTVDLRFQSENLSFCEESFQKDLFLHSSMLSELKIRAEVPTCHYATQIFSSLNNLRLLRLEGGAMTTSNSHMPPLPQELFSSGNLQELEIVDTVNERVTPTFLKNGRKSRLKLLAITKSFINFIEEGSFNDMPYLSTLNLAFDEHLGIKNVINNLGNMSNTHIKTLILYMVTEDDEVHNLPEKAFCNSLGRNLETLVLAGNRIPIIPMDLFDCLSKLKAIDMSYSTIVGATGQVDINNFTSLHPYLNIISLNNLWRNINIWSMDTFKSCRAGHFEGCDVHTIDFLPEIPDLPEITSPTIAVKSHFLISDAAQQNRFLSLPSNFQYLFGTDDSAFKVYFAPNSITYIQTNVLYINISGSTTFADAFAQQNVTFAGLLKLRVLDISRVRIQHFRLVFEAPNLRLLDISRNLLGKSNNTLELCTLKYTKALEKLYLSHNYLHFLPRDLIVFLPNIKLVDVSFNRLFLPSMKESLPQNINFSLISGLQVDLKSNVMICDCDLVTWLNVWKSVIRGAFDIICDEVTSSQLSNINKFDICQHSLTPRTKGYNIALLIIVVLGVMIATISTALYRKIILVRYHIWKWERRELKQRANERLMLEEVVIYDGFIIYDSNDDDTRMWITKTLYQKATEWNINLYIKDIVGNAGECKANEIVHNLGVSRTVLIVLSDNLFKDEWVDFALYSAIEFSRRVGGKLGRNICVISQEDFRGEIIPKQFHPLFYPRTFLTGSKVIVRKQGEIGERKFWKSVHKFFLNTTGTE